MAVKIFRQMKDTKGTGCGIWPVLLRGWPAKACEWHDIAHTVGSWQQANMSRAQVDRAFLAQMLLLSNLGSFKRGKRALAWVMYGIVRAVGGIWWEGKR